MKVVEKESDRKAEVHLRAGAIVDPLAEFGEYVDEDDGAICCYVPVPVEKDQRIWISGNFSGTTRHIWHDAIVDGVLRKSNTFSAKKVSLQKSRKLDNDKFMYKMADSNYIDTYMVVGQVGAGVLLTPGEMTETIGTIELRVYVTRELGVDFTPRSSDKYYNLTDNGSEAQRAEFKRIRPTLQMEFAQEDSVILDSTSARNQQRKADAQRPGKGPWAIFRFHYRTPESMVEHNLKVTFDPSVKAKNQPEARILALEPVPPLTVPATKKDDGDAASTKTSSPAPPDTPLTPIKGDFAKPATSTPKRSQNTITPAKKTTPYQLKTMPGDDKAIADAESGKLTVSSTDRIGSELANKSDGASSAQDGAAKANESDTIAVKPKPSSTSEKPSISFTAPQDPGNAAKKSTTVAVVIGSKGPQGGIAAQKLPENKPKSTRTLQDVSDLKPTTTATPPSTPTKRSAPPANLPTPEGKRTKFTPVPSPTTPTIVSRIPPGSPIGSPRPLSTERKVAEMRKARDALRQKRADTATKQAELDEKMKPYQKKLEDELEQLRMEMLEEEALAAEDEEHLKASEMMLAEFEKADDDD